MFYILLVTILAILSNFVQGSLIRQVLSAHELLSEDILSRKTIAQISVISAIALSFAYPIRYKILEAFGFTEVLHRAVVKGQINPKKYLDAGGNPNGMSKYNYSLLRTATWKENLPLMESLIERGADINIRDNNRETPLHEAKSKSTATLLLTNGAKVNAQDKNGNTPLHSILRLNFEVIEVLLKYGADPNIHGFNGKTPLYYVRDSEQAKLLLENNANPNVQDKYGHTPLHAIYKRERLESSKKLKIAETLIQYGANINAKDKRGETPLYKTTSSFQLTKSLIDAGANVNIVNNFGDTLLHNVYKKDVAELLIEKGADVNARDNRGETPLHRAAGREEIMKVLIENGADVNAKNNKGKTPLDLTSNKESVKLLIDNGANYR